MLNIYNKLILFLFYLLIILLLLMQSCERDFLSVGNVIDTTSHNFQWESFTIGGLGGSSYFLDAAIVNENDIWAVGEIYADSIQPWKPYNAVHWDGDEWELKRIPTNSVVGLGFYPLKTVFPFDSDNIWMFSDAGSYCHWNGLEWESEYVPERQGGINKIWGSSPTDIYFVGTNGNITHYNGSSWQKLESGTDVDFRDIWGCRSSRSGEWEILAVTSYGAVPSGDISILKIEGTTVHSINTTGLPSGLSSIWFIPGQVYYAVGDGVFRTSWPGRNWQAESGHPALYKVAIRGQSKNDIFITGSYGLVSHYNGKSWHHYNGSELPTIYGGYWSISYKEDLMVAVGDAGVNGIILRGTRKE